MGLIVAPSTQVLVCDEERLVRAVSDTAHDDQKVEVTGVSELVRDTEAVFFTGIDQVEPLDPWAVDLGPGWRAGRDRWFSRIDRADLWQVFERVHPAAVGEWTCSCRPRAPPTPRTGMRVATMHLAKGLEFRAVALVGIEAGIIPSPSLPACADDQHDHEQQERCPLYVAGSRARERLSVTWTGAPSPLMP